MQRFTPTDVTTCFRAILALETGLERSYYNSNSRRDFDAWAKGIPELEIIASLEVLKSKIEKQIAAEAQ